MSQDKLVNGNALNRVLTTAVLLVVLIAISSFISAQQAFAQDKLTAGNLQSSIHSMASTDQKMSVGESRDFQALSGGTQLQNWNSSQPKVASVDANGVVTANNLGATTISASGALGEVQKWTIFVNKKTVNLVEGKSLKCASVAKYVKSAKKGKWKSSKGKVVEVKGKKLVAKKRGKAKVTLKAGGKKYVISINVSCKHKWKTDSSYSLMCKRKATECRLYAKRYTDQANQYEKAARRYWGDNYRTAISNQMACLNQANEYLKQAIAWEKESLNAHYVCDKCGAKK